MRHVRLFATQGETQTISFLVNMWYSTLVDVSLLSCSFGGSPLDPVYQKGMSQVSSIVLSTVGCTPNLLRSWAKTFLVHRDSCGLQISIVHEAAFLDSKSLVCGDSILGCKPSPTFLLYSPMLFRMTCMSEIPYVCAALLGYIIECSCLRWYRYQKRPLTNMAVREFELCTAPLRVCCDLLCPIQSLQGRQGFPCSIHQNDRSQARLGDFSGVLTQRHKPYPHTEGNTSADTAWETRLRDAHAASRKCIIMSSEKGLGSARPPWDASIYRDPLSKSGPDKPDGEGPQTELASSERRPVDDPLRSNAVPWAREKDTSNEHCQAKDSTLLTAEKSVQYGPGLASQEKQGGRSRRRHAWVPPGMHLVEEPCSKEKAVLEQVCLSAPLLHSSTLERTLCPFQHVLPKESFCSWLLLIFMGLCLLDVRCAMACREGRSRASLHSLCFQEGKRQIEG